MKYFPRSRHVDGESQEGVRKRRLRQESGGCKMMDNATEADESDNYTLPPQIPDKPLVPPVEVVGAVRADNDWTARKYLNARRDTNVNQVPTLRSHVLERVVPPVLLICRLYLRRPALLDIQTQSKHVKEAHALWLIKPAYDLLSALPRAALEPAVVSMKRR
jgi:hypothetical protein